MEDFLKLVVFIILTLIPLSIYSDTTHFGSENCAQCHQKQYEYWKKTAHFNAENSLTDVQKKEAKCYSCHKPDSSDVGVSCESCHGDGKYYAKSYVMKDKELAKKLGLKSITKNSCSKCHNKYSLHGSEKDPKKESVCTK